MKGITFDDDLGPLFGNCTMTCVAVIVVLSTVPRTSTVLPLLTALADAELVPFSYVVDDVSLTVTFSPADVNSPKPDFDTLLTVPIDPPAAGPDRALDPPPRGTDWPDVAVGDVAVVAVPEPVLAVVPKTRTGLPSVMALARAGWVPFLYAVDDVSLTVTF